MPIYEYRCEQCGHVFSLLRSYLERDDRTQCPQCQADQVKRLISGIAVGSGNSNTGSGCGGGGMFR